MSVTRTSCASLTVANRQAVLTSFKDNHFPERNAPPSTPVSSSSLPADPSSLIDYWNTNFFRPRGIEVVLAKGPRRLSGDRALPPPDYEPLMNQPSTSSPPMPSVPPASAMPVLQPLLVPTHAHPCRSASASTGSGCRTRASCRHGCARNPCGSRRRTQSVSSSSSSSDSEDDATESSVGRTGTSRDSSGAPPTDPTINLPVPSGSGEGSSRGSSNGPSTSTNGSLPPDYQGIPFDALPPRAQKKVLRWQKRQERKSERFDKRFARKYAKMEQKLEKKGLYLSPFLPVDLATHGVGMGVGLGMRCVGLGVGLGLRSIGMGFRGVGIGIRGGKGPMTGDLADEEDGYYRLIVTDLSRGSS